MTDPSPPRTLLGWILPPAAVAAALALHWSLNVPPGPLPPPGQKEDERKPAPPKPDRGKTKDDPKTREPPERDPPFTTPRTPGILTQTWDAYDPVEFKNEPTFEAWSAAHRPILNQIIAAARTWTFKDRDPAPTVTASSVECHTVRCRFTLAAPERADVEAVLETLDGLQLGGATIWHKFLPDPIELEPSKRPGTAPRNRSVVTVSFIRDLVPVPSLRVRDGSPLKLPTPAKPPAGATPAGTAPAGAGAPPAHPRTPPS